MKSKLLIGLLVCLLTSSSMGAELLTNGTFEADANADHWPDGWSKNDAASWEEEAGNRFLRLRADGGKMVMLYRAVPVPAGQTSLELHFRVRHTDIKPGEQSWHDGRIMLQFKNESGQQLKPTPSHPSFRGSSKGWIERSVRLTVPEGAATLEIMPAMFNAAGGTLDLDDLSLIPPAPPLPVARLATLPPELRVVGNQLQTIDGRPIRLQGVNVPSLEWSAGGENVLRSIGIAIDTWKANTIRLPVSDAFWFGRGKTDGGKAYRQLVEDAVNAAAGRGAYIVLDLHQYRAPTAQHAEFWKDAATRYANHPAVLFDLLNEPHGISWEVWRNGGEVQEKAKDGKVTTFPSIGMQKLVESVRKTGAKNVLVAGGLDWAYDLSGIMNGHALNDPGGNGIMYATHIYYWKRGWQAKVLVAAAKYPILVGEAGCEDKPMSFIPKEQFEDPHTWAPDLLGMIQKHKLHWTAWSFHPKAAPKIISNWQYEPTPFWGDYVKSALGGREYELKKPR